MFSVVSVCSHGGWSNVTTMVQFPYPHGDPPDHFKLVHLGKLVIGLWLKVLLVMVYFFTGKRVGIVSLTLSPWIHSSSDNVMSLFLLVEFFRKVKLIVNFFDKLNKITWEGDILSNIGLSWLEPDTKPVNTDDPQSYSHSWIIKYKSFTITLLNQLPGTTRSDLIRTARGLVLTQMFNLLIH